MVTSLTTEGDGSGYVFTYHEEVRLHERVRPLFIESKGTARETGDEHDGGFVGGTRRLCPNLGTIGGSDVDGHSRRHERDESEERGELHD